MKEMKEKKMNRRSHKTRAALKNIKGKLKCFVVDLGEKKRERKRKDF